MRVYNRYILSLALLFSVVNVTMAASGQRSLEAYFTVLVIASLVVTLLYVHFSPRVRQSLSAIGFAFFVGFLAIVALRAITILK